MKIIDEGNVVIYILIIIIIAGASFIITEKLYTRYPSDYAKIAPDVKFPTSFKPDTISFSIPKSEINKSHIIYALINDSLQYGIMDLTLSNKVIITKGTYATYVAQIKESKIKHYEILKTLNGYKEKIDLYDMILKANKKGQKYGIQRCLSPFCNVCVDLCKKVTGEERIAIKITVNDLGEVVPVYLKGYCPRCGECFIECPIKLLIQSGDFDEKAN